MDESVLRAMARWPQVPAVHGWLILDRRARWMLVDRGQPGFDEALHGAGSPITNPAIIAFIGRNYVAPAGEPCYWQNGPQRVFVDLQAAPFILRVTGESAPLGLMTHTGQAVQRIDRVLTDAKGMLWLVTDVGVASLDDRDLARLDLCLNETPETLGAPDPDQTRDPASARVAVLGKLRLMGEHPIETLIGDPGRTLGFVARPRPEGAP